MSGVVDSVRADGPMTRGGRWVAVATAVMVVAGVLPFLALGRADQLWEAWIVHNALFGLLLAVVLWLVAPVEPRNPVVWIIALAAGMSGIQVLTGGAVLSLLDAAGIGVNPQQLPPAALDAPIAVLQWFNAWTWVLIAVPLATFLPLLFPDGRLPGRRWRAVAWLAAAALALVVVTMMAVAWPSSTIPVAEAMAEPRGVAAVGRVGFPLLLASVLASLLAPVVRARRAGGVRRRQIHWVGFGAGMFALVTAVSFVLDPSARLFAITAVPGGIALVGSIAVAILRYRLYEIDRLISRTATYALVTAVLVGVYALVAVVPSAMLDVESDLLVAAATLAAAAVFVPVRRRVQQVVDRRFNRARYDAALVVERFGDRLRDDLDVDGLTGDLRGVVAATVQPAHVSLWLVGTEDGS
ncbi:hypothetical protein BH23ACT10_BH23ACT10_16350 [soil metagenome]